MTAPQSENVFQTNTFGFNLPCRQFVISAERTRDRRMPMVDEFILRALNIVGSISATRLARFFGFDGRDLGIAVADLQSRSLVNVEGENLVLHPSAKELFRTSADANPTITTAEPMDAMVWFDLITKSMVGSRGLRNVQHLIPLRVPPGRETFDIDAARRAFDANFRDYLKFVRNDKNADQWSLYAILDVHAGRYSYAQIGGSEQLSLGTTPKLETTLLRTELDNQVRTRQLTDAMATELGRLDYVQTSSAARADFSRILNSDAIERSTTHDGFLDLNEWIRLEWLSDVRSAPFVGYPYTERNRRSLAAMLGRTDIQKSVDEPWELWWLRPGGSKWGATEDLPALLEYLRGTVRGWTKSAGTLATTLVSPAGVQVKNAMVFQRVFDRGLHAKPGKFSLALEVLAIPDVLAVVTVVVALSSTVSVPIGCMTTDPARVDRIIDASRLDRSISEAMSLWPRRHDRF